MTTYTHAEAFCLMTYRSDDGTEAETIWNSRDGVTPFLITLRSGKQAKHVDWHLDQRVPDFKPAPGMRIFIDMTEEAARVSWRQRGEEYWNHPTYPASARYASLDDFVDAMMRDFQPGSPQLVEVP